MQYVIPTDVKTPKKNVKGVHVLYDGGEDSFAIAVLKWVDESSGQVMDKLALRWNGSEESPKGYPCAMGNPSWFIIPAKLEEVLKARAIELNEVEGKAKAINLSNKILEHVNQVKIKEKGTFGFTTYTTSEKFTKDELEELEMILKKNMIFFLKTDDPDDTFDLNLNGDLTIRLNFLNDQV
ncbi:hypothetical protein [Acinetobacter calcoaceticus]|uniref:hypothetical protein n=1 Tax=Acinetobacter calcoaceticus TaxID=471 RepID=UPI0028610106|nr:hypothetical protein [Acinetobacter calcoaceticus]MDR6796841.1 hypothetical protein [Acinetobacter calcoaceticus]